MSTLQKGYTTLNIIKTFDPCSRGWEKLLKGLGKNQPDDEPLHILKILELNGWDDTRWAFRCFNGIEKELMLFAADCAEAVLPIFETRAPLDDRPRMAIHVARKFANGEVGAAVVAAAYHAAARAADAAAYHAAADAAARAAAAASRAASNASHAASNASHAASNASHAVYYAADAAADADAAAADAAAAYAISNNIQIENFKTYFNK